MAASAVQAGQPIRPPTSNPTGDPEFTVNDVLARYSDNDRDPFLILHEFGPKKMRNMSFGMHPHRGFNEVPYIKAGGWTALDHWGSREPFEAGMVQWGMIGSGIEHGGAPLPAGHAQAGGMLHGFQLWVNLPSANKMDPPCFQDAAPDATPTMALSEQVAAKLLVGSLAGKKSPIQTKVPVQYVDYMVAPGGSGSHPFEADMSARFVYVYKGSGSFGANQQRAQRGQVMKLGTGATLSFKALDAQDGCHFLVLAGKPLREPIVQYGPFVMSSRAQIQQAFRDFQQGRGCAKDCKYIKWIDAEGKCQESTRSRGR